MISYNTPPGAKIVCINAQDCEAYLREGGVYTLRAWIRSETDVGQYGVDLEEATTPPGRYCGYHPRRFRPAVLPKVLTDLLVGELISGKVGT